MVLNYEPWEGDAVAENLILDAELARLRAELMVAFRPGGPVSERDMFAGRWEQLNKTLGAVSQRGVHVCLFGEPGVGKTTLARLIDQFWREVARIPFVYAVRYNCSGADTFESVWSNISELICDELSAADALPQHETWREVLDNIQSHGATPHAVRRFLHLTGKTFIVVIDEFNQIKDVETIHMFSSCIKTLADNLIDTTLVIVGVADTVDELIHDYSSIQRNLTQVLMPRMTESEVVDLLTKGYEKAGMNVADGMMDLMAKLSQGMPHYGHRFGQEAGFAAVTGRKSTTVDLEDVKAALPRAVQETEETIRSGYQHATYTTQKKTAKYREVLLACALAPVDDLGFFSAADITEPLIRVTGKQSWDVPQFVGHLKKFSGPDRGPVLQMTGGDWGRSYRFIDPLMRAYVVLKGMQDGMIDEQDLSRFIYEPTRKSPRSEGQLGETPAGQRRLL